MLSIEEFIKLYKFGNEEVVPKIVEWFKSHNNRSSWESYEEIYDIDGFKVPYIPLLNNWKSNSREYSRSDVQIEELANRFEFSQELHDSSTPTDAYDGKSCRLAHFDLSTDGILSFTLQETSYFDYLKSGEYLDFPYPGNSKLTNRDAFGRLVSEHNEHIWPFENLTNICGVGLIILTSDDHIIFSKHSEKSHVYPGRITFASSGIMSWGRQLNPFDQVSEKCYSEMGHRLDSKNTRLIGFGVDARKLYFQFSFLETSEFDSKYFLKKTERASRHSWSPDFVP